MEEGPTIWHNHIVNNSWHPLIPPNWHQFRPIRCCGEVRGRVWKPLPRHLLIKIDPKIMTEMRQKCGIPQLLLLQITRPPSDLQKTLWGQRTSLNNCVDATFVLGNSLTAALLYALAQSLPMNFVDAHIS